MNKTIITSLFDPIAEVQDAIGLKEYQTKISNLTHSDLCIELNNVLAAKHNLMMVPSSITEQSEKQEKITDLTDKVVLICIHVFGFEAVAKYDDNNDFRKFNESVNQIDSEIALLDLESEEHGRKLLDAIDNLFEH